MSMGVYLGNPVGPFGMVQLPDPEPGGLVANGSGGVATSLSRAAVTQMLASGGASVQRKLNTKRGYSIQYSILTPAEIDTINGFFTGVQGGGPYCLVDPSWGNQLPANVSAMGAVLGALPEWSPTVGTLTSNTTAPPTGIRSGVGGWAGATSSSTLYAGLNNIVDGTWLPPILQGISVRFSIWAKTTTGTATVTPALTYGIGGSAPAGTAATGSAGSLTTTWQQLTVPVASSFSWPTTSDWIMPKLTCSAVSGTPTICFAGAEFVYDTAATAAALSPWVTGLGVPRVLIPGDVPSPVDLVGWRDYTLTLQEA